MPEKYVLDGADKHLLIYYFNSSKYLEMCRNQGFQWKMFQQQMLNIAKTGFMLKIIIKIT